MNWRQILPAAVFVPGRLLFAMGSGCAETKTGKVTVEGPERKYEVKLEVSKRK